jgi:hypothetical protein
MEFLVIVGGVFTIAVLRWIWLIKINAQKSKRLLYAIALLQYEQVDKENGAANLEAVTKSFASELSNPLI